MFVSSLFMAVFLFVIDAIYFKLILCDERWLLLSLLWSVYWSIGNFLRQVFSEIFDTLHQIIIIDLIIVSVMFATAVFTFGVLFSLSDWLYISYSAVCPFAVSLLLHADTQN